MNEQVALQRFLLAHVAVLGTVTPDGGPHLVPVTFVLVGRSVAFAIDHKPKTTARLRRLANIQHQPRVSFLVHHYSPDWSELWWVRVDARHEDLPDGPHRTTLIEALGDKYPEYRRVVPTVIVSSTIERVVAWAASDSG